MTHALAAQPAVIIARLLVFLAPIMQPKNAATAAQMLHAPLDARNSLDAPNTIALQDAEAPAWDGATLTGRVAPYSLTMWTVTDN